MSYGSAVSYDSIDDYIEDLLSYKLRFSLLDSDSFCLRDDGSTTFTSLDSDIPKYIEYPFYEGFKTFVYSIRSASLYKYADIVNLRDKDYETKS